MKTRSDTFRLAPKKLRAVCTPSWVRLTQPKKLSSLPLFFGHDRAVSAIKFGLTNKTKGFNIFLVGDSGSGKTSILRHLVKEVSEKEPTPPDWVYVYNFDDADRPIAISLEPGVGVQLRKDLEGLVEDLKRTIPKVQEGDSYLKKGMEIDEQFRKKEERAFTKLQKLGAKKELNIEQVQGELLIQVMKEGRSLDQEEFEALSAEERQYYEAKVREIQEQIGEYLRMQRKLEKTKQEQVRRLEHQHILDATQDTIKELQQKYSKSPDVRKWLDKVWSNIPDVFHEFQKMQEDAERPFPGMDGPQIKKEEFYQFRVNVLVNNADVKGAPVVFENTPTYHNLVGCVEYNEQYGLLYTDFTLIKAGSLHRANGGYLIIQVNDLLKSYFAWDALKKALRNKEVAIQELDIEHRARTTVSPKPQPIPLQTKVIIIGNLEAYYTLLNWDDDFARLFKVKAEFDEAVPRTKENIERYTGFISRIIKEDNLLPFDKGALAAVVEYGSRVCEQQNRLTSRFINIINIVSESHYWARSHHAKRVTRAHVTEALHQRRYRTGKLEFDMYEQIREGTVLMDTDGDVVGQINGIAVYDLGDHAFGIPSRITAATYAGRSGVVNIDREVRLSGVIHSKASLILIGLLGQLYAQEHPLAFSASLVFEQMYGGIDGDSASCAELFALLSSLARVPIHQGIAVTGSVNQRGQVQPIGGVNEKIEGVYQICKAKGLTGNQGVIIPALNEANLMLDEEVVQAVKAGKFHVYSIRTVDEGIEILTGMKAGKRLKDGSYSKGSFHELVNERLQQLARAAEESEGMDSDEEDSED